MFLNTLLEQNNGKRSLGILTNAYAIALTKTQVVRKMLFPPCSIDDLLSSQITIIINKEYWTKENAKMKQVLKENRY